MDGGIVETAGRASLVAAIAASAERHDRDGSFPFENFVRLQGESLLGLTARPEDGGGGAGLRAAGAIIAEIGRACPSTALVLSMQLSHVHASARNPMWPEHLRARVGRTAAAAGALINALRVEPALGTPARGGLPETTARRVADGWSITGRKIYSTGAPGLTWMLVWARTDEDDVRVGTFLVPARSPGISIVESWDHLGLRASGSHDVLLHDVFVPFNHAVDLRRPGEWRQPDAEQAAWNAVSIGSIYTGVARAARDWVIGFLRDRVPANLGAPLATLPRMQEAVGAIEALLVTNTRLIDGLAADHDRGTLPAAVECGLIKTIAAENAIAAVEMAVKLAGNHGLSRANPLERHLRDVHCARIHTPQQDVTHLAAGRAALQQGSPS